MTNNFFYEMEPQKTIFKALLVFIFRNSINLFVNTDSCYSTHVYGNTKAKLNETYAVN